MKPPRGLSAEEADAWAHVARTVRPLKPPQPRTLDQQGAGATAPRPEPASVRRTQATVAPRTPVPSPPALGASPPQPATDRRAAPGLDSHWDRRFRSGGIEPDFTLDLHGHTLDQAHGRLDSGLAQARAMGARVVLVIAGKPRPVDAADRGTARGAIRAKLLDWLAAGPHGASVSAVRQAHRKHGGEGALYLIMKRSR